MAATPARCRALSGKIFIKNLGIAAQPFLPIGNAQAELTTTETEQTQPDFTNPAGGNACSFKEIDQVGLALTIYDFRPENLNRAVLGDLAAANATAILDEAVTIFNDGALIAATRVVDTAAATTLTVGATTYVEDTDYSVSPAGFIVIAGSALDTAVNAGAGTPKSISGLFDYVPQLGNVVEALRQSSGSYALKIEGLNKADSNKAEVWTIHKVLIGPTGSFTIISREFGSFTMNGSITADTSQPAGKSQYFKIEVEA